MESIIPILASIPVAVAAWFAVNFFGRPILALREARLDALRISERYSTVVYSSSDELRSAALKALHDASNTLLAYHREHALATRL